MAGKKLFRGALFGFKRGDVNSYIERLLKEQAAKIKDISDELEAERNRTGELTVKNDELFQQFESMTQRVEVLNSENDRFSSTVSMLNADVAEKSSRICDYELEVSRLNNLLTLANEENEALSKKTESILPNYLSGVTAEHIKQSAEDFLMTAKEKVEDTIEQSKIQTKEFLSSVADLVKRSDEEGSIPEEKDKDKDKEEITDVSKDVLNRFKEFMDSKNLKKQDEGEKPKGDWRDFFFR